MVAQTSTLTREQIIKDIIAIAMHLPVEKLTSWYYYGLFMQSPQVAIPPVVEDSMLDDALKEEFAMWEEASDEDALMIEEMLKESA